MKIAYELPEGRLDNKELAALYEGWTEEKIQSKTGIATRHVAAAGETATDIAERAAKRLFAEKGVDPAACDFLLFCTQAADYLLPSSACVLQSRLGLPTSAGAFCLDLGCSGYIYGLATAKSLVSAGMSKSVLLLTGDVLTRIVHPMDKSVRTIFGDAATATLVDGEAAGGVGAFTFGTDGSRAGSIIIPNGGARNRYDPNAPERQDASGNIRSDNYIFMDGPAVFRFTLDVVPKMLGELCERNGIARDDVDLFVFHQANAFMLDAIQRANGLPKDKFVIDMVDVGNTASSTIPMALRRAEDSGRLKKGMKVMLMGFGVGLSWGGTVVTW